MPSAAPAGGGSGRVTVSQFVLKVHGRCDLACDHCYIYEHADQSWQRKPRSMTHATVAQAARRIAEHARLHSLAETHVVVHGGEPLLLGVGPMDRLLGTLRTELDPATRLDLRVHTNAVRLSEEYCDVFERHGVRVGVSLDGDRAANDRHRRYADGRGSHRQVLDGLSLLRRLERRPLYAGILCTIDVRNDPISVYQALLEQEPPRVDFLLPHATWEQPPLRTGASPTEYADWLTAIHTRWEADGRPISVRVFEALDATAQGRPSGTEAIGTEPVDLVVIDTDGSYEQADSLKTAYDGAPATGFNVFDQSVDEAAAHPALAARRTGIDGLSAKCRACPVVQRCGGGLYAHRYRADTGFDNPSVYCDDLKALMMRIPGPATDRVQLPPLLEALAHVPGTASPLRELAEAQQSDDRALVAAVARNLGLTDPPTPAWELLAALDQSTPEAVATVLAHPYVRTWAVRCLEPRPVDGPAADHDYLSALALSAAVHAGVDASLTMSAPRRHLHFPTLGTLLLDPSSTATISTAELGTTTRWLPARRLRASGLDVILEDVDDYRDCYQHPAADRLSPDEAAAWQHCFSAAVAFLDEHLPDYLPPLRAGLRSITPLRLSSEPGYVSGTARHAPGAIGIALPDDPEVLALLIIHEFQHVKLWAALERHRLLNPADHGLYRVGWREDPRPAEGVLHGIYAHAAVADYWRAQRDRTDQPDSRDHHNRPARPAPSDAASRHSRWSHEVDQAISALLDSNALAPLGSLFVRSLSFSGRGPDTPAARLPELRHAADTEHL